MTTSSATHWDVAAYALGVLDGHDTDRFEEHLAACDVCAAELESLLPVTDLLSDVDGDSFIRTEQVVRDGRLLNRMANVVAYERSKARARRTLLVAAGVTVAAVIAGLSIFVGSRAQDATPRGVTALPSTESTAATRTPGNLKSVPPNEPGVGGPEETPDERFDATDPTSGVQLSVGITPKGWGTQLSLSLAHLSGPATCRLVVMGPTGAPEVVATWWVPPDGYGTDAQPEPLLVRAATGVQRGEIGRVEVQAVGQDGVTTTLVAVAV